MYINNYIQFFSFTSNMRRQYLFSGLKEKIFRLFRETISVRSYIGDALTVNTLKQRMYVFLKMSVPGIIRNKQIFLS